MTKKEAISLLASWVENHIEAGDFWFDSTYEEEVEALAKLGHQKAKEVVLQKAAGAKVW